MYSCVYSGHILFTIVKMAIGHPHSRSRSTKVGVPPGRVACVRMNHERTRQIDETFKYFINLAWHRKYKDSMHLAGSRESWRLSPRVNHSQRTTRESAARQRLSERDEWRRMSLTRAANEVSSFTLKSRSFELIRSRTSHHYCLRGQLTSGLSHRATLQRIWFQ